MKIVLLLLTLGLMVSCSSAQQKKRLAEKIEAEEVRSFQEIKSHTDILLEEHPELDAQTKGELRTLLTATMNKQQDLKEKESKIFQVLLQKSLRFNELSPQELKDKNSLKKELSDLYEKKSDNVLGLIKRIVELSKQQSVNDRFQNDMIIFLREFR